MCERIIFIILHYVYSNRAGLTTYWFYVKINYNGISGIFLYCVNSTALFMKVPIRYCLMPNFTLVASCIYKDTSTCIVVFLCVQTLSQFYYHLFIGFLKVWLVTWKSTLSNVASISIKLQYFRNCFSYQCYGVQNYKQYRIISTPIILVYTYLYIMFFVYVIIHSGICCIKRSHILR